MPLLVGSTIVTPPTTPPSTPTPGAPVDPGEYVPTWIDPDGVEWALNAAGREFFTVNAASGYGVAPVSILTRADARGGVTVLGVRPQARVLTWPVRVRGRTHMEFLTRWRQIGVAFAATRRKGPGLFRLTRPDGTAREVLAYYQAGWDGEPGQGWLEDTPVLSLLVPDPFWRDATPTVIPVTFGDTSDFFDDPFPLISSGSVIGSGVEVYSPGEVEAWPEWTIIGPASGLTATNNTTGKTFTLTYDLDVDEQITITTRPGRVLGPAGQMLGGALTRPGSTLWNLQPGLNNVDFLLSGGAEGSSITLRYHPRYETA